jgi:hypothetical protein
MRLQNELPNQQFCEKTCIPRPPIISTEGLVLSGGGAGAGPLLMSVTPSNNEFYRDITR